MSAWHDAACFQITLTTCFYYYSMQDLAHYVLDATQKVLDLRLEVAGLKPDEL